MTRPLTREELAAIIAAGEDSFTEFKDHRAANDDVAKELCAFLNAAGGRVLIGIGDGGGITGAGSWDEERVMNIVRTSIEPSVIPTYQRVLWQEDVDVVVVSVDQGVEKPYAWKSGQETRRYFMRVGSTSREATREELIRLTQASGAVASDLRPVPSATQADLDAELLAHRFEGRRSIRWDEMNEEERRRVLIAGDILHGETGNPTIAGLLCYGRSPQERLSYAILTCVAYPGTSVERELLDRAQAGGRVDQQVERATEFIERNIRAASRIEGTRRRERTRPSLESFRELVANAVAHRHYGIAGPSHVRVFSDRVEVSSPGGLPNGVTVEGMRVGISVHRNEFIVQHLESLGIVDAVGRGMVLLFEEAVELGLPEPQIEPTETWTEVTLFLKSEP